MPVEGPNRVQRSVLPVKGEPDYTRVVGWRKALDPDKLSVRDFIQMYSVPTKVVSLAGGVAMKKFEEFDFQREGREIIERQWDEGTGGKTLGGKPRQQGETTGKLLLAWERFLRGGGGTGNYFSYDDPHSMEAFALLLSLKRQTPAWVFEHLVHETKDDDGEWVSGGGVWTKKSSRQLELSFPGGVKHLLQCATAGGKSAGSGSAPRWIFLDEITLYDAKTKADMTGMTAAWQDAPGNVLAMWGTGRGMDRYARLFLDHYGHENPDGFVAYFRSWLGHGARRVEFRDAEARAAFVATVGTLREYGVSEELALLAAKADPEELNWRRIKLADPTFNYDLKLFAREFPLTVADSFASESGSVLQVEILKTHDDAARAKELRAQAGDFVEREGGRVEFQRNRAGSWTLYEEPRRGLHYCWGADPASGRSRQAGTSTEADFATARFAEVYTGRVVARFRAHLEGRAFGYELVKAAVYFAHLDEKGDVEDLARGYPETNGEWGQATLYRMELKLDEFGFKANECIMLQHHPVLSDGRRPEPSLGWHTSSASRGRLIDDAKSFVAEIGSLKAGDETPYDVAFLAEAYCFERDEKNRVEASEGHDDDVFAEMLMVTARDVLLAHGDVPLKSAASPRRPESDVARALREMDEKAAKEYAEVYGT